MASFIDNWWRKHDMDRDGRGCAAVLAGMGCAIFLAGIAVAFGMAVLWHAAQTW